MILKNVSVSLNDFIEADDLYLPLTAGDLEKIKAVVPDGEQIYLVIEDNLYKENVLATNNAGYISVERGIDSLARKFPRGSCVSFQVTIPVVKWLICNYECCASDCPVAEVTAQGVVSPIGTVGKPWAGSAIFAGDLPMLFGIAGLPNWCTATWSGNSVKFEGTPNVAGNWVVSVSATNNKGQAIAVQNMTITVQ